MTYTCTVQTEDKNKLSCSLKENSSTDDLTYTLESFTDGKESLASDVTSITMTKVIGIVADSQSSQTINALNTDKVKIILPDLVTECPDFYYDNTIENSLTSCSYIAPVAETTTAGYCECTLPSTTNRGEYTIKMDVI